ncbi:MAG: nitrous oxide reductase family maturation protein NosD [Verrucomicrobiales bacterium]|nr:nitrous oxide reductase family maturation protein NosD [Verrucomicrobiales bacterium]
MHLRSFLALLLCGMASGLPAAEWHVGEGQQHASLNSAVAAAAAGDTIFVHGGRHAEGNLRVTKPLHLIGQDWPVLDGGGGSEVLTLAASGASVRGFVLTNTGRSSIADRAGVRIDSASGVTIENNRFTDCHFAVFLARSRDCQVLRNRIESIRGLEQNSGNGIHLWNCEGIHVQDNAITGHRDGIYLEFASRSTVEGNNVVGNLRYGLHFMYSHDSSYHRNRFSNNGAGVAVMYSHRVDMRDNRFDFNWGAAAYGLLLKDISDSTITGNTFDHNSTAVYAQSAVRMTFEGNRFLHNGWALRILGSSEENSFRGNDFSANSFDIGTNGRLAGHLFSNNYWDRCEGYDLNRDGVSDIPFQPVNLYAVLVEKVPPSVLLLRSFMVQLLDRAEKAFPSITPEGVTDGTPAMHPHFAGAEKAVPASPDMAPKKQAGVTKTASLLYLFLLAAAAAVATRLR